MSHIVRKHVFVICEQQRRKSACTSAQSDQRLCFSLPRQCNISSFYMQNLKPPASLCSWEGQFESYWLQTPKTGFSWHGSNWSSQSISWLTYRGGCWAQFAKLLSGLRYVLKPQGSCPIISYKQLRYRGTLQPTIFVEVVGTLRAGTNYEFDILWPY